MTARLAAVAAVAIVLLASANVHPAVDPYRWMETQSQRFNTWISAQSKIARDALDASPLRKPILQRINELHALSPNVYNFTFQERRTFFYASTDDRPYSRLFVRDGDKPKRLLVDVPLHKGLMFYSASSDGRYVVYGVGDSGSELSTMRVMDVDTGKDIPDEFPAVRLPAIQWAPGAKAFFYTRLASDFEKRNDSEKYLDQKTYLHRLGTGAASDEYVFGPNMPSVQGSRSDGPSIGTSDHSPWIIGSIGPTVGGAGTSFYAVQASGLNGSQTRWRKVADRSERVSAGQLDGNHLYLALRNEESGYTIVRRSLNRPDEPDREILRFSNGQLNVFVRSSDSLYVAYSSNGRSSFKRIPLSEPQVPVDVPVDVSGTVGLAYDNEDRAELLFQTEGWAEPSRILRYDPVRNMVSDTGILPRPAVDFSAYIAEEKNVRSRDGVKIPLTIIRKRDAKLDGTNLVWLTGYGSYGQGQQPNFDPIRLAWLERGGSIAIAHVRGGGDLGQKWHLAGKGSLKINSVNDFVDCAQYLIDQKYTRPNRFVASSDSAGGIIVGMAMATRPDLFAAIAIHSGMLNALRFEEIPIGPANVEEFGTAQTFAGRRSLAKIDAYNHLVNGRKYPPVLLSVGLDDQRVSVWQSGKFAARLMDINRSVNKPNPVLLLARPNAGHAASTWAEGSSNLADMWSFFLSHSSSE